MHLRHDEIRPIVQAALAEDLPWGDVTTDALIETAWQAEGRVVAKAAGVVAGLPLLACTFHMVDPTLQVKLNAAEGQRVSQGNALATVTGSAASILRTERVALNFVQHLSGIATLTARFVAAIEGLPCRIVDTRKTAPGLRRLEKYAVRVGGGYNHRFSLSDGVLVKDNHLALLAAQGVTIDKALTTLRARAPHPMKIEIEVETLEQLDEALAAGADIVLLDNMDLPTLRRAVTQARGRAITEASGGISLETVRAIAETGVELISIGALTHSAPALDISLDLATLPPPGP